MVRLLRITAAPAPAMATTTVAKKIVQEPEEKAVETPSGNLVVNGDFNQDVSVGWKKAIDWDPAKVDEAGVNWAKVESNQGTNVLHLYHQGNSKIILTQEIPVTTMDLELSVSLRLQAVGAWQRWSAMIFYIELQDNTGRDLVDISWRVVADTDYNLWIPSPVQRIVAQEKKNVNWATYNLNLRDELSTYLVGVKPEQVKKVVIKMYGEGNHTDSLSELWVDNISLKKIDKK